MKPLHSGVVAFELRKNVGQWFNQKTSPAAPQSEPPYLIVGVVCANLNKHRVISNNLQPRGQRPEKVFDALRNETPHSAGNETLHRLHEQN